MSTKDGWTATYEAFHGCTEKLSDEIDRFTDQTRTGSAILNQSGRLVNQVEDACQRIEEQVKIAEQTWAEAEKFANQIAEQAASQAAKDARLEIQKLISNSIEPLNQAAKRNSTSATQLQNNISQARNYMIVLSCLFLVLTVISVLATLYFTKSLGAADPQTRVNASKYEALFQKASDKEWGMIQSIIKK